MEMQQPSLACWGRSDSRESCCLSVDTLKHTHRLTIQKLRWLASSGPFSEERVDILIGSAGKDKDERQL